MLALELPPPKRPLTEGQDLARHQLALAMHALAGRRGQSELADLISSVCERQVLQSQVSHWLAGTHGIPSWLSASIHAITGRVVEDCRKRLATAEVLHEQAGIRHIAVHGPATPDPDDEPAPQEGPDDYRPDADALDADDDPDRGR